MEFISVIGLLAGFLSAISFFPQAIKVIRSRDTKSISLLMYVAFTSGVVLWLAYGIFRQDIAIILTNGIILIPANCILFFKVTEKKREAAAAAIEKDS